MLKEPYRPNADYGEYAEAIIKVISKHLVENDDDFMILAVGSTGSGKSTLLLHLLEACIPPDRLSLDLVALSRESFATKYHKNSVGPRPRALLYDEANVAKRRAMSKWNNDLMDLYYSNRGLNMLHLWANPSLDMIDKPFLDDKINGIIFFPEGNKVIGKDKNGDGFRYYYYFPKQTIQAIYEKYRSLSIKILSKNRKKAWYLGWFKKYKGVLLDAYLDDKDERMKQKAEIFKDRYGEVDLKKPKDVQKILGISPQTLVNYSHRLTLDEDYVMSALGKRQYTEAGIAKLRLICEEVKKKLTHQEDEE